MSTQTKTVKTSRSNLAIIIGITAMGLAMGAAADPASKTALEITEYPLATAADCAAIGGKACTGPAGLAFGPDGKLWIAEMFGSGKKKKGGIGRMALDGSGYTEFTPNQMSPGVVLGIAAGPDNNLWFTSYYGRSIGRVTPKGEITEFDELVPGRSMLTMLPPASRAGLESEALRLPYEIIAGPDGNMWFTVQDFLAGVLGGFTSGYVGRFSPSDPVGTLKTWTLSGIPSGLTADADGNIWVISMDRWTDHAGGGITRIGKDGATQTFPLPASRTKNVSPIFGPAAGVSAGCGLTTAEITAGPDGNLWFTEELCRHIGRFSPSDGSFTFFTDGLAPMAHLTVITAARDGNLYVGDDAQMPFYKVWQITPQGKITGIDGKRSGAGLWYMTSGPDGNVWFAARFGDFIGKLTIPR